MIYLDNAATTFPKPRIVRRTVSQCLAEWCGNPGRSAHTLSLHSAEAVWDTRVLAAELFGMGDAPENVIFTANATGALNLALKGVLRPGDHVLASEFEHNSVLRPLKSLEEKGVEWERYPVWNGNRRLTDDEILAGIVSLVRPQTRMVVANHASNVCGIKLPLSKIGAFCRQRGILFLADVSQSAGVWDVSVMRDGIDFLCMPGHKSLFGIQGTGMLLVRPGAPAPIPLLEGGNGVASMDLKMPDYLPERLEAGTVNVPGIAALGAGIQYVKDRGMEEIREKVIDLYRMTMERLLTMPEVTVLAPEEREGSVISCKVDRLSPAVVAAALNREGICVRSGYHCAPFAHQALGTKKDGTVRISFSCLNRREDPDRLWRSLQNIIFSAASANG